MEETAYAKINLALQVRARRPDGYHELETLFAFAEEGDRLSVRESEALTLQVTGPFAGALDDDNLAMRAAEALRERFAVTQGAALALDKRLPVASGIGGGSADAAAALRLLNKWWGVGAEGSELLEIAAGLGADVPACVRSETCRGRRRGDELEFAHTGALSGTPLLLVNPGVPVSTAAVFRAWDGIDRGPLACGDPLLAAREGRNDLEAAAVSIAPEIAELLAMLSGSPGLVLARMSGSGATCFALFETMTHLDRTAAEIAARRPAWWRLSTRIR
jgi:4-diphosphocytidyl-2-C-methyl-D-erythritol kinase